MQAVKPLSLIKVEMGQCTAESRSRETQYLWSPSTQMGHSQPSQPLVVILLVHIRTCQSLLQPQHITQPSHVWPELPLLCHFLCPAAVTAGVLGWCLVQVVPRRHPVSNSLRCNRKIKFAILRSAHVFIPMRLFCAGTADVIRVIRPFPHSLGLTNF